MIFTIESAAIDRAIYKTFAFEIWHVTNIILKYDVIHNYKHDAIYCELR